jgi:hypothetical protein
MKLGHLVWINGTIMPKSLFTVLVQIGMTIDAKGDAMVIPRFYADTPSCGHSDMMGDNIQPIRCYAIAITARFGSEIFEISLVP